MVRCRSDEGTSRGERLALVVSMAAVALAVFVALHAVTAAPEPSATAHGPGDARPAPILGREPQRRRPAAIPGRAVAPLGRRPLRRPVRPAREPDGSRLTAVTDCGSGFTARLSYDVEGRLVGLGDPGSWP